MQVSSEERRMGTRVERESQSHRPFGAGPVAQDFAERRPSESPHAELQLATDQVHAWSAMLGGAIWLTAVAWLRPALTERRWAEALLMLAVLVLLPLAMRLVQRDEHGAAERRVERWLAQVIAWLQLPSGLLLGVALLGEVGGISTTLALPWLATLTLTAVYGAARLCRRKAWLSAGGCVDLGLVYVVVGGGWAVLDRAGARPLDFEPVIVLLTAIHFHYAGFLLPLLTGLAIADASRWWQRIVAAGVLAGVPLVAVGITSTQLGFTPLAECGAATLLAVGAATVGGIYLRWAADKRWPGSARVLWGIAGATLLASMGLAALYGARAYLPVAWLDIPRMRALHGTANALGFALGGLLGWLAAEGRANLQGGHDNFCKLSQVGGRRSR
ncbi:MAG: hypothetical protein DWQ42_17535 [Planctomycetota bacterium]|nr:MAG: hypothetical protein DWQ42_17535 [Planctomycetota bacterium]REK43612.1 MAG: hypothetical protein DWQ46_11020 [Planctomycetota bacterium]